MAACKVLPHHVVCAYLKTLANAWITSSRLGAAAGACVFGCGCMQGDSISHLAFCKKLQEAASPYMPAGYSQWPMAARTIELLCLDEVSTPILINRIIWMEITMHCSNVIRRRPHDLKQMVVARVRALCRESPVIRRLLKEHRAHDHSSPQQPPSLLDW